MSLRPPRQFADSHAPLCFLAAQGGGGLVAAFPMWLSLCVQHLGCAVPAFETHPAARPAA